MHSQRFVDLDLNFVNRPRDTYVIAGNHVTLPCVPPPSVPAATVMWFVNIQFSLSWNSCVLLLACVFLSFALFLFLLRRVKVGFIHRYKDDGASSPTRVTSRDGPFPIRQFAQGDLHFTNAQFDDSGQYFCVAYNDKAVPPSRTSPTATLTVEGTVAAFRPLC